MLYIRHILDSKIQFEFFLMGIDYHANNNHNRASVAVNIRQNRL